MIDPLGNVLYHRIEQKNNEYPPAKLPPLFVCRFDRRYFGLCFDGFRSCSGECFSAPPHSLGNRRERRNGSCRAGTASPLFPLCQRQSVCSTNGERSFRSAAYRLPAQCNFCDGQNQRYGKCGSRSKTCRRVCPDRPDYEAQWADHPSPKWSHSGRAICRLSRFFADNDSVIRPSRDKPSSGGEFGGDAASPAAPPADSSAISIGNRHDAAATNGCYSQYCS